jgi:N-acetylneuraminic acid mutarotase
MKKMAVLVCVCFAIAIAQNWQSISSPSVNADRMVHSTVYDPDSDMIYMIGGMSDGNYYNTINNYVYAYDPVTDAWNTSLTVMPTSRGFIQGAYWNGKIYIVGGVSPSMQILNTHEVYDIASNSWSTLTSLPQTTGAHGTIAWNGNIYVIGGSNLYNTGYPNVYRYNIASDTWSSATSLPQAWEMGGCTIWENVIYLCGGYNRNAASTYGYIWTGTIDTGNPDNITWAQSAALPTPTGYCAATAMDGYLYILGGFDNTADVVLNRFIAFQIAIMQLYVLMPFVTPIARNHYAVSRSTRTVNTVYSIAGDADGDNSPPNNYYYKIDNPLGIAEGSTAQHPSKHDLSVHPSIGEGLFTVSVSALTADKICLTLHNSLGQKIDNLYDGTVSGNVHTTTFSAAELPAGVYFLKLTTDNTSQTEKIVVTR